ncbi:MAG: S8 family serine peptidase [Halobacteriota archaeon]
MVLKKAMIRVDEADQQKRSEVDKNVSKILASYPTSILAEVSDEQIDALKRQNIGLDVQEGANMIRLRAVEFDTSQRAPPVPARFSIRAEDVSDGKRNYWIVQFVGPVKQEWGKEITSLGGELHGYVPENAFLVNMDGQTKEKVEQLPFVNWVGLYEPAYKISPLLVGKKGKIAPKDFAMAEIKEEPFKPVPDGNVTVLLHDAGARDKVSRTIKELGGSVINTGPDMIRASIDPSKIDQLAKIPEVKWIEPRRRPKPVNDVAAQILGAQSVISTHGFDGDGQIVGIADTGIDRGSDDATMHKDFQGRIVNIHSWPIPSGLAEYIANPSLDDGAADKASGHGTHVAGSVLGNGASSAGKIHGMAPKAQLVFQAIEQYIDWKPEVEAQYPVHDGYSDANGLVGLPDDLNELFQQAYDDGARIHTNSWGGSRDNNGNDIFGQYTAASQDIDEFMWKHKDMLILFAAGNEGNDANGDGVIDPTSLSVEPSAKNCLSVGASENSRPRGSTPTPAYDEPYRIFDFNSRPFVNDHISDNPEGMVAFSSRGPTADGRVKPDVVAPGTNILSVRSQVCTEPDWGPLTPESDPAAPFYKWMGGTSMATPLVAGTAAVARQYVINTLTHSPSGALVKAVLVHGAVPLAGQYTPPEVGPVPNSDEGWGRVNLENSLFPAPPVSWQFKDDAADAVGTGEFREFSYQITDSSVPLQATLVWTDFPSDPTVGGGLVNTLRLSIVSPDGTVAQGGPLNNNVQQAVIAKPTAGEHKVRVDGINVTTQASQNQRQEFAIVLSGGLKRADENA